MKKYNLYVNGSRYSTETEDELFPNLKDSLVEPIKELQIGESHFFTSGASELTSWEIERVV